MSGPEALGLIVVVAIILGLIVWVFGEVCDLLIFWWQKRRERVSRYIDARGVPFNSKVEYWPWCNRCGGNMGRYGRPGGYLMRCEQCGNEQDYAEEEMVALQRQLAEVFPARRAWFAERFGG